MKYLPLFHNAEKLRCLVVGAGNIAVHKIKLLLEVGAEVKVVAPNCDQQVLDWASERRIKLRRGTYSGWDDYRGFNLVIAATSDRNVNRRVSTECREAGITVNVVDDPELSDVIFSAVWRDEPLVVAVSTSGAAPFLASEIRNRIRSESPSWGEWVRQGGELRSRLLREEPDRKMIMKELKSFAKGLPKDDSND